MFSLKIIDTDDFLNMPLSSRLLYYDLSMRADDDGFVSSPQKIMKIIGATPDDFKLLCVKQYIFPFESGICVIKDWKIHNYIQSDRYQETLYKDEKKRLNVEENGMYTKCIQNVSKMDTQVRARLGKDNNSCSSRDEHDCVFFKNFWEVYPRKQGKAQAKKRWQALGLDKIESSILADIGSRLALPQPNGWLGVEMRYIPLPATYLNAKRWEDVFLADKVVK